MKSVGEVMAIGRTFQESFQKALRGLEVGVDGLNEKTKDREVLEEELGEPGPDRIWYVGDAFAHGFTLEEVHQLTRIDPWFLAQIKEIVEIELGLETQTLDAWKSHAVPPQAKGLCRPPAGEIDKTTDKAVREKRLALDMRPVYKRVDTCAAEFATNTAYMYSTYEAECECAADRQEEDHGAGRRPEPHRPGHRVRLLLRACGAGDARGRL